MSKIRILGFGCLSKIRILGFGCLSKIRILGFFNVLVTYISIQ